MDRELDVRVAAVELRQARHQPLLQKRSDRADVEYAATSVLTQLLHRLLQLGQSTAHAGEQQRTLGTERNGASATAEQRHP